MRWAVFGHVGGPMWRMCGNKPYSHVIGVYYLPFAMIAAAFYEDKFPLRRTSIKRVIPVKKTNLTTPRRNKLDRPKLYDRTQTH
jgi:hypothetical protein